MPNEINETYEINEIRITNDAERVNSGVESYSETAAYTETSRPVEIRQEREFPLNRPDAPPAPRKRKQTAGWYRIFLSTVVVAAVVTLELVGFSNWTGATVRKHFLQATDSSVFYEFLLEGVREGDQAVVEVYNDFQKSSQPVKDLYLIPGEEFGSDTDCAMISGEAFELKPNMVYVVELLIEGRSVFREKVRTTTESLYDPEETIEPWTEPEAEPDTEPEAKPDTEPEPDPEQTSEQDPTQSPDGSGDDGGINIGDDGGAGAGNGNGENDSNEESGNDTDPTGGP